MRRMQQRTGFTLIELLVVIAIIAVLATLTVGTSQLLINSQRATNTETTLRTTYKALRTRWSQVVADAKKETPSDQVLALASNSRPRAQVLWIKIRLLEAFPQSFSEINNPAVYTQPNAANPYIPARRRQNIRSYQQTINGISGTNSATESSACLLMALSSGRGGSGFEADVLGRNVADTDGDSVNEIVDGWNVPIRFVRFGINIKPFEDEREALGVNHRQYRFRDPVDPDGTLAAGWANISPAQTLLHPFQQTIGGSNATYNVQPYLGSAGSNGTFGNVDDIWSYDLNLSTAGN